VVDKTFKGMKETAGVEFYESLVEIAKAEPDARIGSLGVAKRSWGDCTFPVFGDYVASGCSLSEEERSLLLRVEQVFGVSMCRFSEEVVASRSVASCGSVEFGFGRSGKVKFGCTTGFFFESEYGGEVVTERVCVGKHHNKNKKKKEARQRRKLVGNGDSDGSSTACDESKKMELRLSLEEKWKAENALAAEKARKDLEYQRARDVTTEVRSVNTKLLKQVEVDKVSIEKAFSALKASNKSGCVTVLSGEGLVSEGSVGPQSDSISPNSSASMAEFWAVQKRNVDLEAEVAQLKREKFLDLIKREQSVVFSLDDKGEMAPSLAGEIDALDYRNGGSMVINKFDEAYNDYELMGADMSKYVPTHITVKGFYSDRV
jgi:hypothetical protein